MKQIEIHSPRSFLLVFDKGDDLLETLREFAQEHAIRGGSFVALGAFSSATIAWWNPGTKQYEKRTIDEQVEVLNLTGDVGVAPDGTTRLHAHVTLGKSDLDAIGGHVVAATIYPTLEMTLFDFRTRIVRDTDADTGLSLITL